MPTRLPAKAAIPQSSPIYSRPSPPPSTLPHSSSASPLASVSPPVRLMVTYRRCSRLMPLPPHATPPPFTPDLTVSASFHLVPFLVGLATGIGELNGGAVLFPIAAPFHRP
ncbi:hypothetical protein GUJ93_ZPchr0002g24941 [Zizania palustris]|uniref:Uncharacterized protein n=1 Tax=Zizania palustris TaxID=103762 RepID=A0A8J5VUG3_ZIZPA|nr:hypothetical protein GUJ93_ZPchr0002g24941 [Zizania palustris]